MHLSAPDATAVFEATRPSFARSNFKVEYDKYSSGEKPPISRATQVYEKVDEFLFAYCRHHRLTINTNGFNEGGRPTNVSAAS